MAGIKAKLLPRPIEVPPVTGAEDWREMYPQSLTFDDGKYPEASNWENKQFWYQNNVHYPKALRPLNEVFCQGDNLWLGASSSRVYMLPEAGGSVFRVLNGYIYNTSLSVADPDTVEHRTGIFEERWAYTLMNWDRLVAEWEKQVRATIKEIENLSFTDLPEYEPITRITDLNASTSHEILSSVHNLWRLLDRVWAHHFELFQMPYGQYMKLNKFGQKYGFAEICRELVKGARPLTLEPEERLKELAKLAAKLGLQSYFKRNKGHEVAEQLSQNPSGQQWLKRFDEVKYPYFLAPERQGLSVDERSWIDDPVTLFDNITNFIRKLERGESIERDVEGLLRERDKLTEKCRAMITNEEDKQVFEKLLSDTRKVAPFSENHNFYIEFWSLGLIRKKILELGDWLVRQKVTAENTDIWYLKRYEIDELVFDTCLAWGVGSPLKTAYWQDKITKRKKMWERLSEYTPPFIIGEFPEGESADPTTVMVWGITKERVAAWEKAVQEEEEDILRGLAASRGIAEGPAVVVSHFAQTYKVKNGDILVTSMAAPSWSPVLAKCKAAVLDAGGSMCHAAVMAREKGVPAVVGTGFATRLIKTGDILRVDGNSGEVKILKRITKSCLKESTL